MPRYRSRPRNRDYLDDQAAPPLPHPITYVQEPVKTGLLDAEGNPIYRLPDPVGFLPKVGE